MLSKSQAANGLVASKSARRDRGPVGRRRLLLASFFGILFALSTLHLWSGLADNGDFERDICPYMVKPVGFSAYSPSDPSEHERRFVRNWYDRWELRPGFYDVNHVCQGSAHQVLLLAEVLLNKFAYSKTEFSLVLGGLVPRAMLWCVFLAFSYFFYRLLDRTYWFLIPTTLAWCLFNESLFASLINSFYEDLSGILWLCATVLCMFQYLESDRRRYLYLGGASLALLTATKTGYVLSPFLMLGCFVLVRRQEARVIGALCLLAQLVAFPLLYRDSNRPINAYHATYLGALELLPADQLAQLVKPKGKYDPECIGQSAFASPDCYQRNKDLSHADAARIYLSHPKAIFKAIDALRREAVRVRIELGREMPGVPGHSRLGVFNVWAKILPVLSFVFYPFLLLCCVLLAMAFKRAWFPRTLRFGLLFTLTTSLTQYLMILADGLADYGRHGLLATFSLCLFVILSTCGGIVLLLRSRRLD